MPEILQDKVRPEIMGEAILKALNDQSIDSIWSSVMMKYYEQVHHNADERAADAIVHLLQDKGIIHDAICCA